MFTTTAVVLTIGIARLVEGRTQEVNLVAFSGAILIMVGVIADRLAEPRLHLGRRRHRRLGIDEITC
jgi:hypothetical protein